MSSALVAMALERGSEVDVVRGMVEETPPCAPQKLEPGWPDVIARLSLSCGMISV